MRASMSNCAVPDGGQLSLDAVGLALVEVLGDESWASVEARLLKGGKSNLTYELRSAGGELILRRPPLGDVPAGAHDMKREVRVLRALAPSPVPVPEVVLYDDGGLLGRECYVMRKVEGHIVQDELPAAFGASEAVKHQIAYALVDTLATLHKIDAEQVGLGDFGHPDGYLDRQVRRWTNAWQRVKRTDVREIELLSRALADGVPPSERHGIVHGDFRIDNCLLSVDLPVRIAAVLDWEMSTYGDPLADLGALLFYWRHPDEPQSLLAPAPSRSAGFPRRGELVERYARSTGASLDHLAFYRALACFKLAVIAQDIVARGADGSMGGQQFGELESEVRDAAAIGLDVLGARGPAPAH
jgi:aminoglycoside phosphotransferase (APT) family kinase protein